MRGFGAQADSEGVAGGEGLVRVWGWGGVGRGPFSDVARLQLAVRM